MHLKRTLQGKVYQFSPKKYEVSLLIREKILQLLGAIVLSRLNCLKNALVKYILPIRYPLGNVMLETIKIIVCYNVLDFQQWKKKSSLVPSP